VIAALESAMPRTILVLAVALLACVRAACAQGHPEIEIGQDLSGRLKVSFDPARPFVLGRSPFPGIAGFADGSPGVTSLVQDSPADGLFKPASGAKVVMEIVSLDAGLSVWNEDGTVRLQPGQTFTLGSPPFHEHPVWSIAPDPAPAPGSARTVRLRLRDAAGICRESAVFGLRFIADNAPEAYFCPMKCEGDKTYDKPGLCPVCQMHLKLATAKRYFVTVTPDGRPPEPGVETTLRIVLHAPDATVVKDLEVVHEKILHLLMVSSDLSWFAHEHPVLGPDGAFTLKIAFPRPGTYTLFHDFTPLRVGQQVVPFEVRVPGPEPAAVPLVPDADREQSVGPYRIRLQTPGPLAAIRTVPLTFTITRDGAPVTDLEPFLGTLGHLVMVSQDLKDFVHSHPLGAPPAPGASGPDVVFRAQFPRPGLYKAWAQFQHRGQVITAPFVLTVGPPADSAPRAP
jgi:hypothetical protein